MISVSQSASITINGITPVAGPGMTLLASPQLATTNVQHGDYFANVFTVNPGTTITILPLGKIAHGSILWVRTDFPLQVVLTQLGGSSTSGVGAATSIAGGDMIINLNGDGGQPITLAANITGLAIAADIQAKVRALTAVTPSNQPAYDNFTATFDAITIQYILASGTSTIGSSLVITNALLNNMATPLKLGVANGGIELAAVDNRFFITDFVMLNADFTELKLSNENITTAANVAVVVAGDRDLNPGTPGIF